MSVDFEPAYGIPIPAPSREDDPMEIETNSSLHSEPDGLEDFDLERGDDWVGFDEEQDQEDPKSLKDMERELDEMLFADEEKELWELRRFYLSHIRLMLILNWECRK